MSDEEFDVFLKKNKEEVDRAAKEFEKHSREFDKKLRKIFLM